MILLAFILGNIVGSFINALAMGILRGKFGWRSCCDNCQAVLTPAELVPLFAYLWQRGRCRHCRQKIHWRHPLSELLLGLTFVLIFWLQGWWPGALVMFFASSLFVLVLTDLEAGVLPDQITLSVGAVSFAIMAVTQNAGAVVLATFVGLAFFGLQHLVSRGLWVGGGDIRLGAVMGAMLGDWRLLVLALTLAYIVGALVSVILVVRRRATIKSRIPFAPFLALGTFITLIVGQEIFDFVFLT